MHLSFKSSTLQASMKLMPSLGNLDPGGHLQLGLNCQPKPSDEGQFVTSMVRVVNVGSCI